MKSRIIPTHVNLLATLASEIVRGHIAAREVLRLELDELLIFAREFLNPKQLRSSLQLMLKRRDVPTLAKLVRRDAGGDEKPKHKPFKPEFEQ